MPRRGSHRSHRPDQSFPITRREFITGAVHVAVATAFALAATHPRVRGFIVTQRDKHLGEGRTSLQPEGNLLEGGEIFESESILVGSILDKINRQDFTLDPSITRSIVYYDQIMNGISASKAKQRAQNIYIRENPTKESNCLAMCVDHAIVGMTTLLTRSIYEKEIIDRGLDGYLDYLWELSHEGGHLSIKNVDRSRIGENYGFLGSIQATSEHSERRGFHFLPSDITTSNLPNLLTYSSRFKLGEQEYNFPIEAHEEFFADRSGYEFGIRLLNNGLSANPESVEYFSNKHTAYVLNIQALQDISDPFSPWKGWWGNSLSYDIVSKFHKNNDRHGFFLNIGKAIVRIHRPIDIEDYTDNDIAGLGMLALSAWLYAGPFLQEGDPNPRSQIWQLIEDEEVQLTKGLLIIGAWDLLEFRNQLLEEFGGIGAVDRSIMTVASSPQISLADAWLARGLRRNIVPNQVVFQG